MSRIETEPLCGRAAERALKVEQDIIAIRRAELEEMCAHAREASPEECCGLIGGVHHGAAHKTVYRLRNVARRRRNAYEAAPEDLFRAQRLMRERGEQLLAIYHSHPQSSEPVPSEKDVRLAYYPSAVYFIIGFREGCECGLGAFRISEREGRWERADFRVDEG